MLFHRIVKNSNMLISLLLLLKQVKVCIIELDQRGTGLYNSFVGYHPEDTMVVIRCLRQLAGKPLVDLLWFDYSTLHARGLMSDPKLRTENVLARMRLQMSEMKATCRVSKEVTLLSSNGELKKNCCKHVVTNYFTKALCLYYIAFNSVFYLSNLVWMLNIIHKPH